MIAANRVLPAFHDRTQLPTIQKVQSPRMSRKLYWIITVLFFCVPVALLFLPWQQTVEGRGRVIAYDPTQRQQVVTARIPGQIKKWYVVEQTKVKAGDRIVDIEDNDPDREKRLEEQRRLAKDRLEQGHQEFKTQERVIQKLTEAVKENVQAAKEKVKASKNAVQARKNSRRVIEIQIDLDVELLTVQEELFKDRATPGADVWRARVALARSKQELERLNAEIDGLQATVLENEAQVTRTEADGQAAIATASRTLNTIQQNILTIEQSIQQLDTDIERFKARRVVAPCDGTILRIEANVSQGGAYVKDGDILAVIVPDSDKLVVELLIDGLDAPLIQRDPDGHYPHVRLQFEGWPALQFSGWPSVSQGTFGGRILQIDATDNGRGQFRVLIEPDAMWENDEWPSETFLRQGNQAIGWVFLQRVSLGWEMWRRLNGFPPIVAPEEPGKNNKDTSGKK